MRTRRCFLTLRLLLVGGIATVLVIGVARCAALDRSAEYRGNRVYWQGRVYAPAYASWFAEEETIAKTADGKWRLNAVAGDETRRLIVLRSFFDQYLFVDETYAIPEAGAVTAVFVGDTQTRVENETFCRAVETALSQRGETFTVVTENLYALAEPIAFCYEGCAVAPRLSGFIGVIDGRWAATDFTRTGAAYAADGTRMEYEATFWVLEESLIPTLKESSYFR